LLALIAGYWSSFVLTRKVIMRVNVRKDGRLLPAGIQKAVLALWHMCQLSASIHLFVRNQGAS